jgi:hypothetical protein
VRLALPEHLDPECSILRDPHLKAGASQPLAKKIPRRRTSAHLFTKLNIGGREARKRAFNLTGAENFSDWSVYESD